MNLTETLLFLLVVLVGGMFANQLLEINSMEKEIKRLKKVIKQDKI